MMHGHEKSDPAIVAKKPANNAGQPAAERVERRAGTEGNAGQQSTRRAQDRESVSQALERVRQAAKQRRKERFTALFHHINSAMLRTAFFALKRDAAAGVDGVTRRPRQLLSANGADRSTARSSDRKGRVLRAGRGDLRIHDRGGGG
jgi:RNA-directed DNA polymerase